MPYILQDRTVQEELPVKEGPAEFPG